MVVTLLLALLLASPTVARAAQTAEGTATVPRFEPAAEEIYYLCAPHGLTATHHDQVNADLLAFIKA